jgi:hypothetical protein
VLFRAALAAVLVGGLHYTLVFTSQALALPAKGELNVQEAHFAGPFRQQLVGYFHRLAR